MIEVADVLTEDVVGTLRSAAGKLAGCLRRQFRTEGAERYCGGSARRAERILGWERATVETGLGERKSGVRCLDAVHQRGRMTAVEKFPERTAQMRQLVEPTAQAEPKFQTTLVYTRITARRVREVL